jgi:PAS domain S-box-containing protein
MNKALMERFGDQTGNICYKAFFNRESPCLWSKLEDVQRGETIRWEQYLPRLEGTFEIIDSPLINKDGKISKLGILRDISIRKHAEEALQETRDYLENLINHANAPIIVWDREGRITLFNCAFERLTGYAADKVIGQEIRMLFPEEKLDESLSRIASALAGEYLESVEIPILCKDGDLRIVLWSSSNIYAGDGKTLLATIAQGIDITDRLRTAEEKKKLEAQLRQAQKMEAIGTLAGGIAHEFNNILGAIMGYTELAQLDAGDSPLLKARLDKILQAGNRAKNLVKQILTFSRQSEHKLKPIQANLIVKEMLKLLRASLPTTIEMRQDIQGDAMVMGDPIQIHQVLMNLCTNAAHAMRDKGGLLDVSLVNVELDSDFVARHPGMKTGPYLQLTVSDTGHGIPPDMLDRIFEPFFTTKEKGESTGLGLSVVHGIVKSYGGTIYAYSEPGKGSSFKVYFPAIERRLESEKREKKALAKGIEHILFVDDEQMLVDVGKQLLESLGYKVTTRTSSTEALELFRSRPERFDIVITDQTMPNMTGVELAKELMAERFDIPVILCTGFSTRITQKSVYEMGIRGFLMKPFLLRDLAETIRKVLDE